MKKNNKFLNKQILRTMTFALLLLGIFSINNCFSQIKNSTNQPKITNGYAPVNGLKMYYQIQGQGQPLILIHGAYCTIEMCFGQLIPQLAKSRQVIAVELQGHGRTEDINRPLSYEFLADDIAELLTYLKIKNADVFGYSIGGGVALQVAIKYPSLVRKLIVASATFNSEGWYPEILAMIGSIKPEMMEGSPMKQQYDSLAPNPKNWPSLVQKLTTLDTTHQDWKPELIKSIKAPTLLIAGDADAVKPEHTIEMFRLLGGGVPGEIAGIPNTQLAIFPGTSHMGVVQRTDLLAIMIPAFLDYKKK